MSVEAMSWALNLTEPALTPVQKLVLIGIANHDGDGGAWPKMATLARYAGVTPRRARAAVEALRELGLIEVDVQAGGTGKMTQWQRPNLYRTVIHREDASVRGGRTPASGGGGRQRPPLVEPSVEPSNEPAPSGAREKAREIVTAWWEWHQREFGTAPTSQSYIACVKVVERLVKSGRHTEKQIKRALREAPTISVGAMELSISKATTDLSSRDKLAEAPMTGETHRARQAKAI